LAKYFDEEKVLTQDLPLDYKIQKIILVAPPFKDSKLEKL